MPRIISADSCIACGTCESECPVNAIAPGDVYSIDDLYVSLNGVANHNAWINATTPTNK